ncbi:MAG TPA: PA2169 family four-helix-bundle protein [Opitutaceae bacterium]|nr:PA2169 family four-helix-bundle protein [Opitutaceae bacterium]
MKTSDDTALALLESLLRVCEDSAAGYATAMRDVADIGLTSVFTRLRQERLKLADDLVDRIRQLRGHPTPRPTLASAAHRKWMDIRAGLSANPQHALLTEIERGERFAVDAYRTALATATRHLFEHQYEVVQAAHDRIRQLRDRSTSPGLSPRGAAD